MEKIVKLDQIEIDHTTQSRSNINKSVVNEYSEAIDSGIVFPSIILFYDGEKYWIADGYHRYFANKNLGFLEINADVRDGTKRDAILHSLSANTSHGLRRTNEDKKKSVLIVINDDEWCKWTDRKIAEVCDVSVSFVGSIRRPEVKKKQQKNRESSLKNKIKVESDSTNAKEKQNAYEENNNPASIMGVVRLHQHCEQGYSEEDKESDIEQLNRELTDQFNLVEEENRKLRDAIATQQLPDDIEIQTAEEIIYELRTEVKNLNIKLQAVTDSRDSYMREVATLKDQCNRQAKQLKKMGVANNA